MTANREAKLARAVTVITHWKSQTHPAAWVCWTPETCEEARADGEVGSCPTCFVDDLLADLTKGETG